MLSPSRRSLIVRFASSSASRSRNLTERYRTLENNTSTLAQAAAKPTRTPTSTAPDTIAGFLIPQEPRAPADDECCMSGCAVCVYDLYEEALAEYKQSVTTLHAALSARHIPESEWPAHIRPRIAATTTTTPTAMEKSKDAVLDAFQEMERTLKEKREKRASVEAAKRARGEVLAGEVGLDLRGMYESIKWVIFPSR